MEREEKIKIAITAGIAAVILLLLVLVISLSGGKVNGDEEKLAENIAEYTDTSVASLTMPDAASDVSTKAPEKEEKKEKDDKEDDSSDESSEDETISGNSVMTPGFKDTAKNSISGNSFYVTDSAILKDVYKKVKYNRDQQMGEMYHYWTDGNMDAVRDLAHLERFEAMSYSLSGTKEFYYYGDVNSEGIPNGNGLACYADDQYYCGQWVNGQRSGDGCWISFYPSYSNYVVKEHMYTGQWANDLPNGQGQEHYDYLTDHMNREDIYVQNAIGGFSAGKYNGEMYVITLDADEKTTEWVGTCENGTWQQVLYSTVDKNGMFPVLSERENLEHHLYMTSEGARNNGVNGIIRGEKVRN